MAFFTKLKVSARVSHFFFTKPKVASRASCFLFTKPKIFTRVSCFYFTKPEVSTVVSCFFLTKPNVVTRISSISFRSFHHILHHFVFSLPLFHLHFISSLPFASFFSPSSSFLFHTPQSTPLHFHSLAFFSLYFFLHEPAYLSQKSDSMPCNQFFAEVRIFLLATVPRLVLRFT